MSTRANQSIGQRDSGQPPFNPLKIIVPVLLALLAVSLMSQWYASNVSLPRYCKNPEAALNALQLLVEDRPEIDDDQRRRYMVAAKLLFLYPIESDEDKSDYILRIRRLMAVECR